MNCHDVEAIAADLARDQLMDAVQREKALAHSASCASCASRLADERALTDGLRFVAKIANEEAPARVETAVLAAFHRRQTAPMVAPARIIQRRWLYAAASVAAIALIVTLVALFTSRTRNAQQAAPQKAVIPAVPDEPRQSTPLTTMKPSKNEEKEVAAWTPQPRRKSVDRLRGVRGSKPGAENPNKPALEAEIATDFIPLMNKELLAQMDGGQVMRVELPRSALMSFGLPMDMERASERIKADVVVGNDGLARAIRFVR